MCTKNYFRLKYFFITLLSFWFHGLATAAPLHEVCFNPGSCCKNNIIELCDRAKDSIDVAMYRFTDRDIYVALINALERGVHVVLIVDELNLADKTSPSYGVIKDLVAKGCLVYTSSKHKVLHHKFAIFDHKAVMTGSYNWTYGGMKNHEDCVLMSDARVVGEYNRYLQGLFANGEVVQISK